MSVNRLIGGNGYTPTVAALFNIANGAGSGSSPVDIAVSCVDAYGVGELPAGGAYGVTVTPSQACFVSVINKSATGFTVVLTPLSTGSISAGSFDCLVHS
jgi:hypothetical protein